MIWHILDHVQSHLVAKNDDFDGKVSFFCVNTIYLWYYFIPGGYFTWTFSSCHLGQFWTQWICFVCSYDFNFFHIKYDVQYESTLKPKWCLGYIFHYSISDNIPHSDCECRLCLNLIWHLSWLLAQLLKCNVSPKIDSGIVSKCSMLPFNQLLFRDGL